MVQNPTFKTWRLIPLMAAPGHVQMAIDRWLLAQHRLGVHPPCLRFYTWSPAALSLGYHQQRFPDHWSSLSWQEGPIDLVRRPTGGRAVLHQGDLTYAVIASGFSGRRLQVYQQLCQFLIEGWQSLGVQLQFGDGGRGYIHNPNCFGTATSADLVMLDGYKLIGSAQVYQQGCVLQHGSMRLMPDLDLFEAVFGERLSLADLPTVLQYCSVSDQYQCIMDALGKAAKQIFGIEFWVQPLSESELQAAISLATPV